jgi:hypothetical protein
MSHGARKSYDIHSTSSVLVMLNNFCIMVKYINISNKLGIWGFNID